MKIIFNTKRLLQKFLGKGHIQKLATLYLLKESVPQTQIDIILKELDLPIDTENLNESTLNLIIDELED